MKPEQALEESKRLALANLSTLSQEVIALQQGALTTQLFVFPELVSICAFYCGDENPVQAAERVVIQAALAFTAGNDQLEFSVCFDQARKGLVGAKKFLKVRP